MTERRAGGDQTDAMMVPAGGPHARRDQSRSVAEEEYA